MSQSCTNNFALIWPSLSGLLTVKTILFLMTIEIFIEKNMSFLYFYLTKTTVLFFSCKKAWIRKWNSFIISKSVTPCTTKIRLYLDWFFKILVYTIVPHFDLVPDLDFKPSLLTVFFRDKIFTIYKKYLFSSKVFIVCFYLKFL